MPLPFLSRAARALRRAPARIRARLRDAPMQLGGVLRAPRARAVALASVVARLPRGMFPLGCLIVVEQQRGSLALAAAAVALLALGDAATVQAKGALVDRLGRVAALGGTTVIGTTAAIAFLFAVVAREDLAVAISALLIGVGTPPVSSSVKALWPRIAPRGRSTAAYSIESLLQQLIFLLGPLLVSAAMIAHSASAAIVAAAVLLVLGMIAYIWAARGLDAPPRRHRPVGPVTTFERSPLRNRRVLLIAITILLQGSLFGALPVMLIAAGPLRERGDLVGVVMAMMTGGGILGTLAILTAASFRRYAQLHLALMAGFLAIGFACLAPAPSGILLIGALLCAAGIIVTPLSACAYELAARASAGAGRTETFALLSAAQAAGTAAGSVLTGAAIQIGWYPLAAFTPALVLAAAALLLLATEARRVRLL